MGHPAKSGIERGIESGIESGIMTEETPKRNDNAGHLQTNEQLLIFLKAINEFYGNEINIEKGVTNIFDPND